MDVILHSKCSRIIMLVVANMFSKVKNLTIALLYYAAPLIFRNLLDDKIKDNPKIFEKQHPNTVKIYLFTLFLLHQCYHLHCLHHDDNSYCQQTDYLTTSPCQKNKGNK